MIDTTKLRELAMKTPEQVLFDLMQQNERLRSELDAAKGMLKSYSNLLVELADYLERHGANRTGADAQY